MIANMKTMLATILDNHVLPDKKIHILEIGTGNGDGTTKYLYDYLNNISADFKIHSYEGVPAPYQNAHQRWENVDNVEIINKFFCDKKDVYNFVMPNIVSDPEIPQLTKEHYYKEYNKFLKNTNFEISIDYKPDIILIDSTRFCHAAIVSKCINFCSSKTLFIVEDDFGSYGEERILKKYFNLKNLNRYNGNITNVWNFLTFNI